MSDGKKVPWNEQIIPLVFMRGDIVMPRDGSSVDTIVDVSFSPSKDYGIGDPQVRLRRARTVTSGHIFIDDQILEAFPGENDQASEFVLLSRKKHVRRIVVTVERIVRALAVYLTLSLLEKAAYKIESVRDNIFKRKKKDTQPVAKPESW